jgi:hypothetical protein
LDGLGITADAFAKRVKGNILNIVFSLIGQEATQRINSKNTKASIGFNGKNGLK